MAKLPEQSIESQIIEELNGPTLSKTPRGYLGYSGLGDNCNRKIWYGFRWVVKGGINGRIRRLFQRGHDEEVTIRKEFQRFGADIIDDQKEVIGFEGHVRGHIDGVLVNTKWFNEDILIEIKTYNASRFKTLVKKTVKESDYTYYCQMQSYMGGLGLNKALFIATCKNDDHRYIEIVNFNKDVFDMLERKSEEIIVTDNPPEKIGSGQSTWFECRFCGFKPICHHSKRVDENCRTCKYGTIKPNSIWSCGDTKEELSVNDQLKGCKNWKLLETL